jgi:NAD(P)H-flavin reductase
MMPLPVVGLRKVRKDMGAAATLWGCAWLSQTAARARLFAALAFLPLVLSPCRAVDHFPCSAKVVKIRDLTHDTRLIRFHLISPEGLQFTPGQYVFLKVPDDYVEEWNRRYETSHHAVSRPYSFASSSSHLPFFELIIKLRSSPPGTSFPPGIASSYVHQRLAVGDVVQFSEPMGDLYLRRDTGRPVVIVAGGTGAAPFISLLEYWFENGFERHNQIDFFFGVRARNDLFLDEMFRQWANTKKHFRYVPVLSNPAEDDHWDGETGYVDSVIAKYIVDSSTADVYLAGPPAMLHAVIKVLTAKGVTQDRIHYDAIDVK